MVTCLPGAMVELIKCVDGLLASTGEARWLWSLEHHMVTSNIGECRGDILEAKF